MSHREADRPGAEQFNDDELIRIRKYEDRISGLEDDVKF